MKNRFFIIFIILTFCFTSLIAQDDVKSWYLLDPLKDNYYGISLQPAYDFLKDKKPKEIIVAVIDSGVDTTQEDLKNVLWRNPKEIAGNGKDDDGNGYVDDVYGWNFLGNKNGHNLKKDVDERTRVYYRFKPKFSGKSINEDTLSTAEKEQYLLWQKAAQQIHGNSEDQFELMLLDMTVKALKKHDKVLVNEMKKDVFTGTELEAFQPVSSEGKQAKLGYLTVTKLLGVDADEKNTILLTEIQDEIEKKKEEAASKNTAPPNYRAEIIGDDYYNINDRYYGNSDVMGPGSMHGTHVSGIIAAERNNNKGMNGIANDVKIMMIRAIPDGDEYDKDVALAIIYAVDNGAKVINMSFGKSFSPEKKWVDEAIHYAETKDVLVVHAAGNESQNVDEEQNFPNSDLKEFHSKAKNFINVGASGDPKIGNGKMIASFSNYGRENVDVFAPGVKIYSTLPGER